MVRSLNKWFLCSSVGFVFIAKTIQSERIDNFSRPSGNNLHPFHVSTTEINFNAADKTLEISCRLFIDDFESCLSSVYHTKADLSAAHAKTSMDSLVKRYIVAHLQIKTDGKQSGTHYLGFEKEDEAVNVFFEVENMIAVQTTTTSSVTVNFSTAFENNLSRIELMSSATNSTFCTTQAIDVSGNSSEKKSYSFSDANLKGSTMYYMLRFKDNSGNWIYSPYLTVKVD